MAYAHLIVDFNLPVNDNPEDTISELDTYCFSKNIVRYEVNTVEYAKLVRLYVILQIHDPFWKLVDGNKTHEVTIYYDDTEILAKAYNYADAPEL